MIAEAVLACALSVHPVTLKAIIHVESGWNELAIHVNRYTGPQPHPATIEDAVAVANKFIEAGYNVDLGLMQVNSRNLGKLGYSVEDAFDPCKSVAGGGAILLAFYEQAVASYGEGQKALAAAISGYNTGNFWGGFQNGYVAKVYGIPDLPVPDHIERRTEVARVVRKKPDPYTADSLAFSQVGLNVQIQ